MNLISHFGWRHGLIGFQQEHQGTAQLQWAYLPESWGVFVLLLIVAGMAAAVFGLYRREQNTCPSALKWLLGALRLTVLMMLVALLLRPSIYYQQINEIKPNIDVLRDDSLSFARHDEYRNPTDIQQLAVQLKLETGSISSGQISRSELVNRALADSEWIRQVREKGTIQIIDFSNSTVTAAVVPAIVQTDADRKLSGKSNYSQTIADDFNTNSGLSRFAVPELVPDGLGTDIWQALKSSLEGASNLAAIILLSDGQHNGREDPVEMALRAASLDIPVFTVGVGDPHPPVNLAVTEVYVSSKAYPDEPFEIEVLLQYNSSGESSQATTVALEVVQQRVNPRTNQLEAEQVISRRNVALPVEGGRVRMNFDHTIAEPARYVFTARTDALQNETNLDDNQRQSSELVVVDEKVRVLLISGLPSWDYQQVQRLLQRDSSIELSCWLQSMDQSRPQEGNRPISRLPRTLEELGEFNVVLLLDPNPREFDAHWIEELKQFCKNKAGGVLFMAGPQFTSEFVTLNRLYSIRDLLPVRMGDLQFIDSTDALTLTAPHRAANMLVMRHSLDHPVMSFHSDPSENERLWSMMPGVYWSFPVLDVKPTARVLMERGDLPNSSGNMPLIAAGRYGAGTVLYFGFQGTYSWRSVGVQAQYFDRFWIQVIRFLVENRSLQGSRRGFLDSDKGEYELGDRITLVGRVLDEQFSPSTEASFPVRITNEENRIQRAELQLLPGSSGQYEATLMAARTGTFQATINLGSGPEGDQLIEPLTFRVVPPKVESNAFWLNEKLLKEIAEKSGGQYFQLQEWDQLAERLPRQMQRVAFRSPSRPLWDWSPIWRYAIFILPVILLATEWSLRKWFKLL